MRFRRSKASEGDRGAVRTASSATVPMTRSPYVKACELAIFSRFSPGGARRMGVAWAIGGGSLVVHLPWLNQSRRLRVRYEKGAEFTRLPLARVRANLLACLPTTWATGYRLITIALFSAARANYNQQHWLIRNASWPSLPAHASARTNPLRPRRRRDGHLSCAVKYFSRACQGEIEMSPFLTK